MPSGPKRRKAAKKKEMVANHSNNNIYKNPSTTHGNHPQGEYDSKSQGERESESGSPLSQENNDHEHPFDEANVASERIDITKSDVTGGKPTDPEDPAGGNIVVEDDEGLVEVEKEVKSEPDAGIVSIEDIPEIDKVDSILNSGAAEGSVASERKQEEDPSYAPSSEPSSGIEEKALHSLAEIASHMLEVEKADEERVEAVPTGTASVELVTPQVEVEESLKSSADDDDEKRGKEDAYNPCSDAASLDIKEMDVNSSAESSPLIFPAEDVNSVPKIDLDTPVVAISELANPAMGSAQAENVEVLEVVDSPWLIHNEDKVLQDHGKVNGTLLTAGRLDEKEGTVYPLEEENVGTSANEGKTLSSANEEADKVFPPVDKNEKILANGVDAVIANEDKMLIVSKEKENEAFPVVDHNTEISTGEARGDAVIPNEDKTLVVTEEKGDKAFSVVDQNVETSTGAASATETANQAKSETPGAGSVENVRTVEASDISTVDAKGNQGMLKSSDSGNEKAGTDKENKKESSESAGNQPPIAPAPATGLWGYVMSCCGLFEAFAISSR